MGHKIFIMTSRKIYITLNAEYDDKKHCIDLKVFHFTQCVNVIKYPSVIATFITDGIHLYMYHFIIFINVSLYNILAVCRKWQY